MNAKTALTVAAVMVGVLLLVKLAGRSMSPDRAISPLRVAIGPVAGSAAGDGFWNELLPGVAEAIQAHDSLTAVVVPSVSTDDDARRRDIRFNYQSGSLFAATAMVTGSDTVVRWELSDAATDPYWTLERAASSLRDSATLHALVDSLAMMILER